MPKYGMRWYNSHAFDLFGVWLRPVERTVRVREAPGSNPGAPTKHYLCLHGYRNHQSVQAGIDLGDVKRVPLYAHLR